MTEKLVTLLIVIAVTLLTCKAQDTAAASVTVNGYKLDRFDIKKNYTLAKAACEARNSRLLEIKTQEIQTAVETLLQNYGSTNRWYIGGTRTDQGLQWNDGTALTYTNWTPGNPSNNGGNENCMEIYGSSKKWNDLPCLHAFGYICQTEISAVTVNNYELDRFDSKKNYISAKAACEARNAWLLEIKTQEIQTAVESLLPSGNRWYIGGTRTGQGFKWNDGTNVTYTNWSPGNPSNTNENEDCMTIAGSKQWNDLPCSADRGYICQTNLNKVRLILVQQDIISVTGEGNTTIATNINTYDGPAVAVRVYKEPDTTNPTQEIGDITSGNVMINLGPTSESHAGNYRIDASSNFTSFTRSVTATVTVHVPANIVNMSPNTIRAPVTTGANHVNCIAYGIPTPTVQWIKDKVAVSTSNTSNVYQTIQAISVKLWVGNAEKSDAGTYTCRASNTVGRDVTPIHTERNVTLTVYGSPTILKIEPVLNCTKVGLSITWEADKETSGIYHRFTITAVNLSSTEPRYENVTSLVGGGPQITTILGIPSNTKHTIKLSVCPDVCIQKLNSTQEHTSPTAVELGQVQDAFISKISDANCFVYWKAPQESNKNGIQAYKITAEAKLVHVPQDKANDVSMEIYNVSNQVTQFTLQTSPNRDYSVKIQTQTCAGLGPTVTATGSCITQQAAPTIIPAPEIITTNQDGTRELKIQIPDESNGQISCILLIMKLGEISTDFSFTINDLNQAQTAAKASTLADNAQYIAVIFARFTVHSSINVTIGDNTKSFCNTRITYGTTTQQQEGSVVYEGRNWPLTDGQTYSYFIVTSTPVDDQILLKTSEVKKFNTATENNAGATTMTETYQTSLIIVASIVPTVVILLIVGGLVGFYVKRKRGENISDLNTTNANHNPAFEEPTKNSMMGDERAYEPIATPAANTGYEIPIPSSNAAHNLDNPYASINEPNYQNTIIDAKQGQAT